MVKFEAVRKLALSLPETTEKLSFGTPAFFVHGKLFVQLREDGVTLAVKTSELDRRALAALEPETYIITPHFETWSGMIVQLKTVKWRALEPLIIEAWRRMAPKRTLAIYDAAHPRASKQTKSSTEKK